MSDEAVKAAIAKAIRNSGVYIWDVDGNDCSESAAAACVDAALAAGCLLPEQMEQKEEA